MKILLLSSNRCDDPFLVYPLGMSVIAQALTEAGHCVRQMDVLVSGLTGIEQELQQNTFDLIGISIRNVDLVNSRNQNPNLVQSTRDVAKLCRQYSSAPLCLGGAGFSLLPDAIMKETGADYGIVGEGEDAAVFLAERLRSHEQADRLLSMPCARQRPALYDDTILDFYYKKTHMIPIQTKRGCACKCVYCTYPALEGSKIRYREMDDVINQIDFYHRKYPEAIFSFVDSVFNDPCGQYRIFLDRLFQTCGKVPFDCFTTPWNLKDQDIELLHQCGMVLTDVGLDAGSDTTLKGMGKNFLFSTAEHCVKRMLELGVGVTCSVMIGGPGETYETIKEDIANLSRLEPAVVGIFSGVRILPRTRLYEIAKQRGMIPEDWNGITSLYFWENGLDPEVIHQMLLEAFSQKRTVLYPPDKMNHMLRTIHKIGYLAFREFMYGK